MADTDDPRNSTRQTKSDDQPPQRLPKHETSGPSSEGHDEGQPAHHHKMGQRGVTRPMAEMKQHQPPHQQGDHAHGAHGEHGPQGGEPPSPQHHQPTHSQPGGGEHKHMEMTPEHRHHMLHQHHAQTLWVYWTLVLLGVWMVLSPLTFSYGLGVVQPAGGRSIWLSDQARVAAMSWSDIISGLLLMVFGWRGLTPNRPVSLWICCFVGAWITFAPVIFWAPTAVAYLNSTLVGMLVLALTVLIPGMPNMISYMKMGGAQPAGWSYNPSSWPQRAVLVALAFAGWATSRYLAAYQMGYVNHAWDPFFGDGTRRVLESDMSSMWPVSDGAFGTIAYTFEFLMAFMGAPARWRTMPWMVTFFGILVIPLGLVHIALVISQPVVVGEWCTFCLLAAALMLPMIPLAADEVVAMCQHIASARRKGVGFWEVFWKGGPADEATMDHRSPELLKLPQQPGKVLGAGIWGMSFPWTLGLSTVIGIVLMATPAVLGVGRPSADIFHLGGALVVVIAVIAMGEPLRIGRYLNVPLGLAIAALPWFMLGGHTGSRLTALVAGLLVAALALPRGVIREHFGGWDRFVK